MTASLEYDFPDGVEILIVWLEALNIEVRTNRPTGSILPYIMVSRADTVGNDDDLTDRGRYSIDVYASTEEGGQEVCSLVHRRIKMLGNRWTGQRPVTISTGTFYTGLVKVVERFRPQPHLADTLPHKIYRFTGIYEVPLSLSAI